MSVMEKVQKAVVNKTKQIVEQLEKTKTALDTAKVEKPLTTETKQIAEQLEETKIALDKKIKQLEISSKLFQLEFQSNYVDPMPF